MKSIMISIKPRFVEKILNGEKGIEIRKTMPKCDLPIDVYIYCTKSRTLYDLRKEKCFDFKFGLGERDAYNTIWSSIPILNGKVVAKFTLKKIEEILYDHDDREQWYATKTLNDIEIEKQTCISFEGLDNYLKGSGYAWHIDNLVIFDRPRELSEFKTRHYPQFAGMVKNKTHCELRQLTKAPQSWCYVEIDK